MESTAPGTRAHAVTLAARLWSTLEEGTRGKVVIDLARRLLAEIDPGFKLAVDSPAALGERAGGRPPTAVVCIGVGPFDSISDATRWLQTQGHPKACQAGIWRAVRMGHKAYGYEWRAA